MYKRHFWAWFMLGLGSNFQILASLSITEAYCLIAAPFFLIHDSSSIRKDGFNGYFTVSILLVIGCALGCIVNHTERDFALRGMATTSVIFCAGIVVYHYLKTQMNGLKWYFIGSALSLLLCTFIFKKFSEAGVVAAGGYGAATAEEIMSGPLFWIQRLSAFVYAPINGWYLSVPLAYSAFAPLALAVFSMVMSASGRSAALTSLAFFVVILLGRKRQKSMHFVGKHLFLWLLIAPIVLGGLNQAYRYVALSGMLGEKSREKYEVQTRRGMGISDLIIGGRASSFVGVKAALDHPIFGLGPWAKHKDAYTERFFNKYAAYEDYVEILESNRRRIALGLPVGLIGCHAVWLQFWVWYGCLGLLFCVYAMFVMVRYLYKDVAVIPQWYGYLAAGIPAMFWMMFFSPLTARFGFMLFIGACLMARAVRQGRVRLPKDMEMEIAHSEGKYGA